MKRAKTILKIVAILLVFGFVVAEVFFQFVRTTAPHDRETLMSDPTFQVVMRPDRAPDFVHAYAEQLAGRSIPRWAFNRFLPYEAGLLISEDDAEATLRVRPYVSLPHSGNFVYGRVSGLDVNAFADSIDWNPTQLQHPKTGLIVGEGSIPAAPEALDAVFFQWGDGRAQRPMTISGDHFAEFAFDNRNGRAYLAMASMMAALDYQLNPDETKITLSSFQFVIEARGRFDITDDSALAIEIDIDIQPVARNRIGVINLKSGIDIAFKEWGDRLTHDHGITVTGDSEWNEYTMEFRYRVDSAQKLLDVLRADFQ